MSGWSIAHVLSSFGVGGQERVALDLAAGQRARGHRVLALSLAGEPDGPLAAEFAAAGVEVARLRRRDGLDPWLIARIAQILRAHQVQVVHTHNPLPLTYAAPAARLIGARVIHSKHGKNPASRGQQALRRAAARLVSAFVAVSEETAAQARQQADCTPDRLAVITNGIRLDRFAPDPLARAAVRAELGIAPEAWVVGTVGRVDANKNQALLLRAMRPACADGAHVVIAGEGPDLAALRAEVAGWAEARHVHLLGRRTDVPRIVAALDVFALTSLSEGLPLVVPEAMASGVPVVATAVGGLPGVVRDGVTGRLCAVDEGAVRTALAALQADPVVARAMGQAGRVRALATFSAERMLDEYLALYRLALDAGART